MFRWFIFRLLEGMKEEEQNWNIQIFGEEQRAVASDFRRTIRRLSVSEMARANLDKVHTEYFDGEDCVSDAKDYVRYRVACFAFTYAIQFWRKLP